MQIAKKTLDKHPVLTIIIAAFSVGLVAVLLWNYTFVEFPGKKKLTNKQNEKLTEEQHQIGSGEVVVDKNKSADMQCGATACPTGDCAANCLSGTLEEKSESCIKEMSASAIANSFEGHNIKQNEQILVSHFLSKWVCGPGWEIVVLDKPKRDTNQYWRIQGSPQIEGGFKDRPVVYATTTIESDASTIKEGDRIYVSGRIIDASKYSIELRDASFRLIK